MNTVVADPPAPPQPPDLAPPGQGDPPQADVPAPAPAETCRNCGAPMAAGQDWCLECGAAGAGRLSRPGGWRTAATVTGLTVLIASGIVAASYAALSSDSRRAVSRPATIAQVPAPAPTLPPASSTPVAPARPPVTPPPKAVTPVKPVIPPKAVTPVTSSATTTHATTTHTTTTNSTPVPHRPSGPQPILLDTDAASVYDPNNHPQGTFGDPSNAIDQDTATAWTAALDANGKLGAGIAIDLKSLHKVDYLRVITDTPGMAVEVYGSGAALPPALTDPGWTHLASTQAIRHRQTLRLLTKGRKYQHVLVWVPRGASGSGGGQVDVAELALLP